MLDNLIKKFQKKKNSEFKTKDKEIKKEKPLAESDQIIFMEPSDLKIKKISDISINMLKEVSDNNGKSNNFFVDDLRIYSKSNNNNISFCSNNKKY